MIDVAHACSLINIIFIALQYLETALLEYITNESLFPPTHVPFAMDPNNSWKMAFCVWLIEGIKLELDT
jgi:hypothetical protein